MVKVVKKERENASSLIRRFSQKVKESGILYEVRRKRYFHEKKSRRQKKDAALWRTKIRNLRRRLLKLGEIQKGQKIDSERIRKELRD